MSSHFCWNRAGAGLAAILAITVSMSAVWAAPAAERGKVVAVDKRTGRPAWEAAVWSRPDLAVPPLVTDELVYVLEEGKTLKALNAATGRVQWQKPVASHLPLTCTGGLVIAM